MAGHFEAGSTPCIALTTEVQVQGGPKFSPVRLRLAHGTLIFFAFFYWKLPAPIRIKLALLPPTPPKSRPPPTLKEEFYGTGVFQQKEPEKRQVPIKLVRHFQPQHCGRKN